MPDVGGPNQPPVPQDAQPPAPPGAQPPAPPGAQPPAPPGAQPLGPYQGGLMQYNQHYAPGAPIHPSGAQALTPQQEALYGLLFNQQFNQHTSGAQPPAPPGAQPPAPPGAQPLGPYQGGGNATPVQEDPQWVQGPGGLMASGPTHTSVIKPDGTIAVTSDSLAGAISLSSQAAWMMGRVPLPPWVIEKYMKACNSS